MNQPYRYVRECAWAGPIVTVTVVFFWGFIGHMIPPYSAALDAAAFADAFRPNAVSIRIGMVGLMFFCALYLVWAVAVSKVMEACERDNNIMSTLQMWGGGLTTLFFMIPGGIWMTATFRPDTMSNEIMQMLYDLGWIMIDMPVMITSVQMIAICIGFLNDPRSVPLFPKWACWFSGWVGFSFLTFAFMPFFKSGPFSRSGLLNYWVEFGVFFVFMIVISYYLLKAVGRLEREVADGVDAL
jgi:hypothetical protein